MVDDTLSPVGFERPFVKANVCAEDRHALACVLAEYRVEDPKFTEQDVLRMVVNEGLVHLGYDALRRIQDYANHRAKCLVSGSTNAYGRE